MGLGVLYLHKYKKVKLGKNNTVTVQAMKAYRGLIGTYYKTE
jgi:hypothetical protein